MQHKLIIGLVIVGLALVGVAGLTRNGSDAQAQDDLPGADTAAVLDYVLNQNPYTDWGTWPADRWVDFDQVIVSAAPHTASARIFVNDIALGALAADDFDGFLPPGSFIVKESYQGSPEKPGELSFLAMMYKVDGFNPAGNDWFWLETRANNNAVLFQGADPLCINCHIQAGNADYLLRYAFGAEPAAVYSEPLPEADSASIGDYIFNVSPYIEWAAWPANASDDFSGYLTGAEPHGSTSRIFVNDRALEAVTRADFDGTLPYGSMVIKENYGGTPDAPGTLAAITLMYKMWGVNPEGGDWYWLKLSDGGSTIDVEGVVEGCIDCHSQDGNSDYLLRYDLPGLETAETE